MRFYIRQVQINNLFEQENNYKINFIEGCNCIYGGNGTGKTTVINLIANGLNVDLESLSRCPFSSITIYTAKTGQLRGRKFLTITKTVNNDSKRFPFEMTEIKYEINTQDQSLFYNNFYVQSSGFEQKIDARNVAEIEDVKELLRNELKLTHIPLSRMHDSDVGDSRNDRDELLHIALRRKNLSNAEIADILDPNAKVLSSLQRQFIDQANENRKQINEKLEIFKSKIIEKVMIDEALVKQVSKAFTKTSKLLHAEPEEINIDAYLAKLNEAGINVPSEKVTEHFNTWKSLQATAKKDFQHMDSVDKDPNASTKKKFEANQKFNSSYFSLFAMTHFNDRFSSILADAESLQMAKLSLTKTFKDYEDEVNNYLDKKKYFSLTDDGHLHIFTRNKILNLNNLSSGEKHIITILGRAALSSQDGSVFVADEPELSLHLDWQRKILPSIIKLSPKSQIIVATHSPAVTAENANEIDLEECF